ncbi:putative reverse transcriptase domain-containing protein [Tanacetum coccineum]
MDDLTFLLGILMNIGCSDLLLGILVAFRHFRDAFSVVFGLSITRGPKSSVKDKILAAPSKVSKVENATAEMLRGLDQLMERKEDGVDRLTKSTHFLAIREDYKMEKLARLYIDEIVAGHGVHVSIISDHDGRFISRVLENITESLKDAIGYDYHSSIRCVLFEALYGRKCRSPVLWAKIGESRRKLLEFEVEDQVLLKVSPWKAPAKGRCYAGYLPKCNHGTLPQWSLPSLSVVICGSLVMRRKDCRVFVLREEEPPNWGARSEELNVVVEIPQQQNSMWSRSFVSSAFTPFIDIAPTALNTSYEVELADGKVVSTNTVLRGCTLVLLNHVFKIDLLPTRLGSFDVIVGMDWLSYHRAVIDCYEKIVRIPLLNGEILEVQGERPEKDPGSLACIKADEKKLDDIQVVRDFPEVFPDDLSGLPPVREIEFRIDLIPGASPVVKSPYRLAPSEMLELSNQPKSAQEKGFFDPIIHHWEHRLFVKKKTFLGHVVNRDGIHVDPSKVESVKNWKTPKSSTEIHSFLGLAGYYQRFIENFSKIAKPLTLLTQNNKTYVWGNEQDEAFRILKEKLCNAPVVLTPDGKQKTVWSIVDCIKTRLASVRMQRVRQSLIGIWSRTVEEAEKNYTPYDLELVAVVFALKTKILEAQGEDFKDLKAPTEWLRGLEKHFERRDDGGIYFFDRKASSGRHWKRFVRACVMDLVAVGNTHLPLGSFLIINSLPQRALSGAPSRLFVRAEVYRCMGLKWEERVVYVLDKEKGKLTPVPLDEIEIDENLCFVEEPIEIVERDVKSLSKEEDPTWSRRSLSTRCEGYIGGYILKSCIKDLVALHFVYLLWAGNLYSEHSTVTYTSVSIPVEDDSDIGSPGVDGPPIMPEDPYAYIMAAYQVPPSPDYIPGPEEPQSPPPLDFVPEPMYPEYIPQEDEILPAEEQPLPAAASPTADSPGYVPESDPEEEPEEDDEDPEEDPADYPADRDDDDEEEEEPFRDDADDEDEDEDEDEEEEEEHPAPADSVPPVHRMTARISIRDEPSISLPPREEVERLLALTTPPPSPLTPLSSPLPHIPSPPFPASPPASVLPASPPLQLLSFDHRTDRPEITLPPRKRLGIDIGPRYKIGESSAVAATRPVGGRRADYGFVGTMDTEIRRWRAKEVGYGIRDVWIDPREAVEELAPMTLGGVNARVTELTAVQEQDMQDIYAVIEDTQDRQTQIYQSVETLFDDMIGQQAVISQLQAADRKSQVVTLEMLQADYQRQVQLAEALKLLKGLQTQMVEFQRQHGPAKGPAQPDAPGEAGSSS